MGMTIEDFLGEDESDVVFEGPKVLESYRLVASCFTDDMYGQEARKRWLKASKIVGRYGNHDDHSIGYGFGRTWTAG